MPPRISLARLTPASSRASERVSHWTAPSFLLPFLHRQNQPSIQRSQPSQTRSASIISSLSNTPGSYNKRIRRGRGPSSGKGKTSGRGHKGQKQHGKVPTGFQGGQTPLEVVHGTRGFKNTFSVHMSPLNIDRIQSWIDAGRIDPRVPITMKELHSSRCIHGIKDGIKLLARGSTHSALRTPINIIVSRASAAAIDAVEKAGGTVTTRYYSKPAIGMVMKGLSHPFRSLQSREFAFEGVKTSPSSAGEAGVEQQNHGSGTGFKYRLPDPTSRKEIEYYRDPAHRGYLSWMLDEGQGPSLFFKTPSEGRVDAKKVTGKGGKSAVKGENRIW